MVTAAIRRGWVQPIFPATPRPASRHILGIWVLLPQPVSPETMTHGMPADGLDDLLGFGGDRQGPRHADVGPVAAAGVVLGGRLPEALLDRRQLFDEGLGLRGIGRKYIIPIAFVAFRAADGTEPVAELAEPARGEGPVAEHRLRDERSDPVHELRRADTLAFRRRRGRRSWILHDHLIPWYSIITTISFHQRGNEKGLHSARRFFRFPIKSL